MNTRQYSNAKEFLSHTGKYLARDEARYGLILGLAKVVEKNPHRFGKENPWFCSVEEEGRISAIAMRTPPNVVILAYFSGNLEKIAEQLVSVVSEKYRVIPGVVGDKELADVYANLWCKKFSTKITHTMGQKIHRLDKVNNVPLSPGKFRVATMADKELLEKWFHAFHIDIGGEEMNIPEGNFVPALEIGWIFLWEDGRPVSMALKTRPTGKGMTVGGVYTPPELRSRGYATSCVAELSRNILNTGSEFCMLYTDLANPTSNSIYKKIGYKEVCDSVQHAFAAPK